MGAFTWGMFRGRSSRPVESPAQTAERARQREAERDQRERARRREDAVAEKQRAASARREAEREDHEARARRAREAAEEIREICERQGYWWPGDHLARERPSLRGGGVITEFIARLVGRD
jgi:hypothetical protein